MTLHRPALAVLTAAFAVGCASNLCGEAENNDGGYANISTSGAGVSAIADFAASSITQTEQPAYDLVCAQTQVVAGTNYRLGLEMEDGTWRAIVFEDFDGMLELVSAEEID